MRLNRYYTDGYKKTRLERMNHVGVSEEAEGGREEEMMNLTLPPTTLPRPCLDSSDMMGGEMISP